MYPLSPRQASAGDDTITPDRWGLGTSRPLPAKQAPPPSDRRRFTGADVGGSRHEGGGSGSPLPDVKDTKGKGAKPGGVKKARDGGGLVKQRRHLCLLCRLSYFHKGDLNRHVRMVRAASSGRLAGIGGVDALTPCGCGWAGMHSPALVFSCLHTDLPYGVSKLLFLVCMLYHIAPALPLPPRLL